MGLADRLNKALAAHDLSVKPPQPKREPVEEQPEPQAEVVEEYQDTEVPEKLETKADFRTLDEAIKGADDFEPDEFGTRLILVDEIGLEAIKLPLPSGKYIVDDIQKRKNGIYEVHLVENNQR